MTTRMSVEVVGVRDAIRSLNRIEPGLRKQFAAEATQIAQPAIRAVQSAYRFVPLSGMERNWKEKNRSRKNFPFSLDKARKGVKVKLDARRDATAVILITQMDPGAAIFETAGRANKNPLSDSLNDDLQPGRTRLIGPVVYSRKDEIEAQMKSAALRVVARVEKELK